MKRTKNLLIALFSMILIVCSVFAFAAFADNDPELVDTSLFETDGIPWVYGETVPRPTGKISYAGQTKNAIVKIIFPNGMVSEGAGDSITLDVEGIYTVEYSADIDGIKKAVDSATFTIRKPLFYVSSEESSVMYYNYVYKDHAMSEYSSTRDTVINSSVDGVFVSLASGDEFRYSRVINLNNLTKDDNIVKVVITPENIGIKDVTEFSVVLTDAHDPDNYVAIKTYDHDDDDTRSLVYMAVAASNGQQYTGWHYSNDPIKTPYAKYVNYKNYGAVMRFSTMGPCISTDTWDKNTGKINDIAGNAFSINMDYAERKVYNRTSPHYPNAPTIEDKGLVADLDEPNDFEELWKGFTTGECYLSIKGDSYTGSSFNFMITEIAGIDGSLSGASENETRKQEIFEFNDRGTEAFDINVDTGIYNETSLPKAVVGSEYPIFSASAVSPYYGTLYATYRVEKDGNIVAADGDKFIPTETGNYDLIYTVADYFGTTKTKALTITAVAETDAVFFEISGNDTSGIAGQFVGVGEITNKAGGVADGVFNSVMYAVVLGDETFAVNEGKFFPTKSGTYTITVTATDYIGQTWSHAPYDVVVDTGDKPVYIETPTLPEYFISGRTYLLPTVKAYDYTDGSGREVTTKIAYVDSEGVKNAVGAKITPIADGMIKTVDVVYYTDSINASHGYEGNFAVTNIPVINATSIVEGKAIVDYTKLFVAAEGHVSLNIVEHDTGRINPRTGNPIMEEWSMFDATSDGEIMFVNTLVPYGLNIGFKGVNGKSEFKAFTVTLTDSENKNQSIKLYYIAGEDSTKFMINTTTSGIKYTANEVFDKGDLFAIEYDKTRGIKYDVNKSSYARIETYFNGEPFNGFSSDKVYVKFGFEGVFDDAEVQLLSFAGQTISSPKEDSVRPNIYIEGEYTGYVKYGDLIRIPKAMITDVIDPYVFGTVTVRTPTDANGKSKIVRSVEGILLDSVPTDRDYYVKADAYGAYQITFYAQDFSGNVLMSSSGYSYLVYIRDEVAPEITLDDNSVITGKVGKTITLAQATATDNRDGNVSVEIYVYTPSMTIYKLGAEEYSFAANIAGNYKVIYVATDSDGNRDMKAIEITVTD